MSPMYFRQAIKKDNVYCQVIPVSDCPAKTRAVYQNGKLEILEGCNVPAHLKTTCLILRMLAKLWDGYPLQQMIYPAAEWLAAYHDIGKVTPAFVTKIYDALHREPLWNPPVRETPGDGGHARNSEIILQEFGRTFARLAGCHHGGSWWRLGLTDQLTKPELGGPEWQTMRKQLLEDLRTELRLPECDLKKLPKEQQPLILGSVILADWLSSGMDMEKESPTPDAAQLQKTIRQAGLVPEPWKTGISFSDLFGFPENSLQKACCGQARRGCLYIIEAGMGSGKTEAALYLAHQLLEKKEANGLYFAMPTRLTSVFPTPVGVFPCTM